MRRETTTITPIIHTFFYRNNIVCCTYIGLVYVMNTPKKGVFSLLKAYVFSQIIFYTTVQTKNNTAPAQCQCLAFAKRYFCALRMCVLGHCLF